jgi:hypothetical protein
MRKGVTKKDMLLFVTTACNKCHEIYGSCVSKKDGWCFLAQEEIRRLIRSLGGEKK